MVTLDERYSFVRADKQKYRSQRSATLLLDPIAILLIPILHLVEG